jgi:hypothetical protein
LERSERKEDENDRKRVATPQCSGDKMNFEFGTFGQEHMQQYMDLLVQGPSAEANLPAAEGPEVRADHEAAVERNMKQLH